MSAAIIGDNAPKGIDDGDTTMTTRRRPAAQWALFPNLRDIEPVTIKGPLALRFEAFHAANPHVLAAIVATARDLRGRGVERASMSLIFERLRWLYLIQTGGDEYRLNNSWRAFYARLVVVVAPDLAGMFTFRVQADEWTPDLAALGLSSDHGTQPQGVNVPKLPANRAEWPAAAVEDHDERAAIIEFHGERTRAEAERLADANVRRAWDHREGDFDQADRFRDERIDGDREDREARSERWGK